MSGLIDHVLFLPWTKTYQHDKTKRGHVIHSRSGLEPCKCIWFLFVGWVFLCGVLWGFCWFFFCLSFLLCFYSNLFIDINITVNLERLYNKLTKRCYFCVYIYIYIYIYMPIYAYVYMVLLAWRYIGLTVVFFLPGVTLNIQSLFAYVQIIHVTTVYVYTLLTLKTFIIQLFRIRHQLEAFYRTAFWREIVETPPNHVISCWSSTLQEVSRMILSSTCRRASD